MINRQNLNAIQVIFGLCKQSKKNRPIVAVDFTLINQDKTNEIIW